MKGSPRVAGVASALAVVAWIGVGIRHASRAAPTPPPPETAILNGVAVDGTVIELRNHVRFVVPPAYSYVADDDATLRLGDPRGVKLVVTIAGSSTDSPEHTAYTYAALHGLTITSQATARNHWITHAEKIDKGRRTRHTLFTFVGSDYRVAVLLVVWGNLLEAPSIERLVSEIADGRVLLP